MLSATRMLWHTPRSYFTREGPMTRLALQSSSSSAPSSTTDDRFSFRHIPASQSRTLCTPGISLAGSLLIVIGFLSGCGGGGTGGNTQPPPPAPTVTITATPSAITAGGSTTLAWSSTNATSCTASGAWSGAQATSGSISESPAANATYTLQCTGTGGSATASASVTVTAIPLPTVTITATPSTITAGGSTTIAWSSTNATSCTASGAWSGAQATSGSISESPSANATYTLQCTGTGGSANNSASVTVTAPLLPNITATSIPLNVIYADWSKLALAGVSFAVSNSASTDTLCPTGFNNVDTSAVSSSGATAELDFGTRHYSPGWLTFAVSENSNCSDPGTSQSIAFLGEQNYLTASPSGFYFLDQAQGLPSGQNGYIREYASDGAALGSCAVGAGSQSIAFDKKTNLVVLDGSPLYPSGPNFGTANGGSCDFTDVPNPQGIPSGSLTASAASNGYAGFVQPDNNSASFYDLTGGTGSQPTVFTASKLGTTPWAIAMGTFGTETDAFVASADGAPSLYKVRASDAYAGEEPALPLPGVTPLSAVTAATLYSGGLQVVVFDSGPASGTVAALSTYDQLLLLVDISTWKVTKSVKLSGVPFRITTDATNGRVLVAYADPAHVVTTYSWVDAPSGTPTAISATSSLLSVGLGFDGTNIILSQRNQIELKPAQ